MREQSKMTMTEERPLASSEAARRAMIDSQLRPSGVNEPWVLSAMLSVPREDFVPEAMRGAAYIDRAIPLGDGRWLAAPLVHGRMLEEAATGRTQMIEEFRSEIKLLARTLAMRERQENQ